MTTFYLDEHASRLIALRVRAFAHGVVITDEMRMKGQSDDAHLSLARQHGWIVVTYNRNDFLLAHRTLGASVLVHHLPNTRGAVSLELHPDTLDAGREDDHIVGLLAESLRRCREWAAIGGESAAR